MILEKQYRCSPVLIAMMSTTFCHRRFTELSVVDVQLSERIREDWLAGSGQRRPCDLSGALHERSLALSGEFRTQAAKPRSSRTSSLNAESRTPRGRFWYF